MARDADGAACPVPRPSTLAAMRHQRSGRTPLAHAASRPCVGFDGGGGAKVMPRALEPVNMRDTSVPPHPSAGLQILSRCFDSKPIVEVGMAAERDNARYPG
mmetsp:Transcript_16959/g.45986  ORF Transcript_16959/g.45986 Transcript_16959/m.45986 type:complete len:102 (-) Transcript_16959:86-391(-)